MTVPNILPCYSVQLRHLYFLHIAQGILHIGVGRFRILGGGHGGGGTNSQQAHDVVMTSMRRNDVISTSCAQ